MKCDECKKEIPESEAYERFVDADTSIQLCLEDAIRFDESIGIKDGDPILDEMKRKLSFRVTENVPKIDRCRIHANRKAHSPDVGEESGERQVGDIGRQQDLLRKEGLCD